MNPTSRNPGEPPAAGACAPTRAPASSYFSHSQSTPLPHRPRLRTALTSGDRTCPTVHRQALFAQITQPVALPLINRQRHTHIVRIHHQTSHTFPGLHNHRHPGWTGLAHRPLTRTPQRLQIHGTQRRLHTQTITLDRQIIKPHRTIRRHGWRDTQLKLRHHTPTPHQTVQTENRWKPQKTQIMHIHRATSNRHVHSISETRSQESHPALGSADDL